MFRERRFHSNIRAAMILGIVVGALLLWVSLQLENSPRRLVQKSGGIGLGSALLLGSLLLIPARRIWTTEVGPNGIRSYDSLGLFAEVPWGAMTGVRRKLGYLWIKRGPGQMHVTVPTWLEDKEGFARYVVTHAPPGNPLRVHFERSGTAPSSGYPR